MKKTQIGFIVLTITLFFLQHSNSQAAGSATITISSWSQYQTMTGWEATAESGQFDSPAFPNYKNTLFDQAVNDLGINRLRVEIKNPTGTAFDFTTFDATMDLVTIPMRQRLLARGEKLFLNVCYVGFHGTSLAGSPTAYAQDVLTAYQHMKSKYGFVPDAWEIILEPDNANWSGTQIGNAIVAAGNLLKVNGFTPSFIAPSSMALSSAIYSFDLMTQVAGAMQYVKGITYHRYMGASDTDLQSVANRALQYNLQAGMLEHMGADYNELHQDLKTGRNSAWQQFTLAYPTSDDGAQYYWIDANNVTSPSVNLGSRTKFLRQYFKFIRAGAVRIGASTTDGNFDPLAFINSDGKYVVVVKATTDGAIAISGLAPGTYGIKYTTGSQYDINLTDKAISSGQSLNTTIPSAGVITIYAKTSVGGSPLNNRVFLPFLKR